MRRETYVMSDGREFPWNTELARMEREVLADCIRDLRRLTSGAPVEAYMVLKSRQCGEAFGLRLRELWADDLDRKAKKEEGVPA